MCFAWKILFALSFDPLFNFQQRCYFYGGVIFWIIFSLKLHSLISAGVSSEKCRVEPQKQRKILRDFFLFFFLLETMSPRMRMRMRMRTTATVIKEDNGTYKFYHRFKTTFKYYSQLAFAFFIPWNSPFAQRFFYTRTSNFIKQQFHRMIIFIQVGTWKN